MDMFVASPLRPPTAAVARCRLLGEPGGLASRRFASSRSSKLCSSTLAITLILVACGGGSSTEPMDAASAGGSRSVRTAATVGTASSTLSPAEAEQLLDFGEARLPAYFPGHHPTQSFTPFLYRHYPQTGIYLGVVIGTAAGYVTNGVYVMGGAFGAQLQFVGLASDFNAPPSIAAQPASASVAERSTATFAVSASALPAPTFQWQSSADGNSTFVNIAGATSSSYTTPSTAMTDNGKRFRVVVTNSIGSLTSAAGTLTVLPRAIKFDRDSVSVSKVVPVKDETLFTDSVSVSSGGGPPLLDMSHSVTYGPGAQGWLETTQNFFPASGGGTIRLRYRTRNLSPGTYSARVAVSSFNAVNSPQTFTVTLTVSACPFGGAASIAVGQTLTGTYATSDCDVLRDGLYADLYRLTLATETDVVVDVSRTGYLVLYNPTTSAFVARAQSTGRLSRRLPAGTYAIRTEGIAGSQSYTVSVSTPAQPIPFDGTWAGVNVSGEQTSFDVQLNKVLNLKIELETLRGQYIGSCSSAAINVGSAVADIVGGSFQFNVGGTLSTTVMGSFNGASASGSYGSVTLNDYSCGGNRWRGNLSGKAWTAVRE